MTGRVVTVAFVFVIQGVHLGKFSTLGLGFSHTLFQTFNTVDTLFLIIVTLGKTGIQFV